MSPLLDTSVAVPYLVPDHPWHGAVVARLGYSGLGLAGHAEFETFSVLTRLPGELRLGPRAAARLIAHNFPRTHHVGAEAIRGAVGAFGRAGITGALAYDALVALAAIDARSVLLTADRKAVEAYAAVGADVELWIPDADGATGAQGGDDGA